MSNPLINLFTPFDLINMSWWEYATGGEKALIVVGIVALVILAVVVASPHVKPLRPIANSLGLVSVETVYVPINHTVYVNKTVYVNRTIYVPVVINRTVVKPVYINKTIYVPVYANATVGNVSLSLIESIAGRCAGDLVFLPNDTAWLVLIWLAPKVYVEDNPLLYTALIAMPSEYPIHYNATTHVAQLLSSPNLFFFGLYPEPAGFAVYASCYIDNVTVNGYYALVCGDTIADGPGAVSGPVVGSWFNVSESYYQVVEAVHLSDSLVFLGSQINETSGNVTLVVPRVNTTYTGIMLFDEGFAFGGISYGLVTLGPVCNVTVIYAPDPQAALYIELPLDFIEYWSESDIYVYGHYNPNDIYMGYWVWGVPR